MNYDKPSDPSELKSTHSETCLKALAIPAPGDLLDWIGQHQRSLLDMMPIERKFKGAAITRFLLDEGNEEIWPSILDIIGENTQADMPKNDSTKAVADKGLPTVGEPVGDNLEEKPLFYMDTSADPAVAVLMENEVNDVAGENGDGDLIIDEDADVIVEEDDDIRIEDDDEVTNEDDLKDQNMDTPALFELNKNLNSEKAHEKDDPDIIEELYVIDTAPTRITLSQAYAEMTPQAENGDSDNEDVELIEGEDVEKDIEKTEEIYVVDTEKWSKKPESIVSQMNLPDTISPICTPPRSSRRARAGVTPKAINVGDSPKSSLGREMKATPKAIIDRAPATDQTRTPVRKSKPNPVETIEEINLDEIVSEELSPKSSITQEMKSSKTGIERRKSLPNPVEVVEEIDLVASDTETKAKYTKLKTPKPKPNEKGIAPISQSKKGKTTLVSPRRTRRTSQMQMEKAVDEITVVEETQPDMFESQDAQIVDNSTQDKVAESKEKKNENGDDVTDVAILEIRQDRVSDTSDNEGNEATTFAIPDISKHLKKGPGENSIKGLKKGENSGVKPGRRREDVASDTSEDTHISSIPNISQHLKTDETQAENSIDEEESTKSVVDKTPKLSKKTKTPRKSSRKSVVKTSPCCEEKKNQVITNVTLTRKNVAALQETDSDATTPMKQKRTKQRNVKLDDKFSPPLLRSRNSSGDSINASTKGTPQKSKSLKKSTGITVYDFHGSASELSDFGTPPKRKILSPISEVTQSLSKSGKKKIRTPKSKIPLEFETVKTSASKTTKLKTPSSVDKLKLPASSRKRLSTPKQTVETLSKLKQAQKEAVSEKRPRRESANY
ncbi:unnamed protein product [Owenia fusiformis]|uniref:Uncharacterized protein n=1 Tax=Owenia fusiformis TaxID=6347 RepID=A0A8S4Q630_OWEFU|nr:unnamed protein product [Owenia fusiformis]